MPAAVRARTDKAQALAQARSSMEQMARAGVPAQVAIARVAAFLTAKGFGSQAYPVARILAENAYQPQSNLFEKITGTEFSPLTKITGKPGSERVVPAEAAWAAGWKGFAIRLALGAGGALAIGLGATMLATGEGIDRAASRFARALRKGR
jgi:hypothetical protein